MARIMMYACFFTFIVAFPSDQWVCRVYTPSDERKVSSLQRVDGSNSASVNWCFGLWRACDDKGCYKIYNVLTNINPVDVAWVQFTATLAVVGYCLTLLVDLLSTGHFCSELNTNRCVEFCLGSSAIVHYLSLLYWTGEVKNKAPHMRHIEEVNGWGFTMAACSLGFTLLSTIIMAVMRPTPSKRKTRRFWRIPHELQAVPRLPLSTLSTADAQRLSAATSTAPKRPTCTEHVPDSQKEDVKKADDN